MTPASRQAPAGPRDPAALKWYVISLLAIILVINPKQTRSKIDAVSSLYGDRHGCQCGLPGISGLD